MVITVVLDLHAFVGNFKMIHETIQSERGSTFYNITRYMYKKRTFAEISLVLFKLHLFFIFFQLIFSLCRTRARQKSNDASLIGPKTKNRVTYYYTIHINSIFLFGWTEPARVRYYFSQYHRHWRKRAF